MPNPPFMPTGEATTSQPVNNIQNVQNVVNVFNNQQTTGGGQQNQPSGSHIHPDIDTALARIRDPEIRKHITKTVQNLHAKIHT